MQMQWPSIFATANSSVRTCAVFPWAALAPSLRRIGQPDSSTNSLTTLCSSRGRSLGESFVMTLSDIVIDANVFAHSHNPDSSFFDSALAVVNDLLQSMTALALDDTGKAAPALETSHMYREYIECLAPGSLAREVVRLLGDSERIVFYLRPERQSWQSCRKLVPKNHVDAIVLGVGLASAEHIVVSNDYDDFPSIVRAKAKRRLGVLVVDSKEPSGLVCASG